MLALLDSLYDEGVMRIRSRNFVMGIEPHEAKALIAHIRAELNVFSLFMSLPSRIKDAEDEIEHKKVKEVQMKAAQEGATI